jgi:UDP-N-acetylglucosamine--N-acetylmuramyl-(pentapeptide) pyrophosphoryl-undecaprenol N-acetylglucosamine transferase
MNMANKKPYIALAAGGTGGHVYPALTLARALQQDGCNVMLLTDTRGARFIKDNTVPYRVIQAATLHKGVIGKLRTVLKLGIGYLQSHLHFLTRKPDAIVGFGGYPSFPPVVAAAHRGAAVILHEQNALYGRAQRMLTRFARFVCLSFAQTQKLDSVPPAKIRVTGLPLRPDILQLQHAPYTLPSASEKFRILITGGSLASQLFSRVIPQAVALLPVPLRNTVHMIQQCRADDVDAVAGFYRQHGISADVVDYIHDMPTQLAQAHLFIGRSGASTVTEIALAGRPAIFIPLAVSLDGDQAANAAQIISAGGGWILAEKDFSSESLAAMLQDILNQPARLVAASSVLKGLAHADATQALVQTVKDALR